MGTADEVSVIGGTLDNLGVCRGGDWAFGKGVGAGGESTCESSERSTFYVIEIFGLNKCESELSGDAMSLGSVGSDLETDARRVAVFHHKGNFNKISTDRHRHCGHHRIV